MSRQTRNLYDLAKLWRKVFAGLANSFDRVFPRNLSIENEDTPHWFVLQNQSSATRRVWRWIRGNLLWTASVVVVLLGLLSMNAFKAHHPAVQPPTSASHRTQSAANTTQARTPDYASPRADARSENNRASPADRQKMVRQLQLNLQAQGLDDVIVVTGGERNHTLVLSSRIFRDSARRDAEMKIARTYWKGELCKSGFTAVALDGRSLFGSSWHEYLLQCPKTPRDRVSMAAGLGADFEMAGKAIQVHATGANKDVLSLMTGTESLRSPANRAALFQQLKNQGIVRNLCAWGFKQVSIGSDSPKSVPSLFSVNCVLR